jgi:flagellar basal-body rod modification protein FlgD
MSSVNALGYLPSPQTTANSNSAPLQEIGKTEFLKLLVTQLQNQDPMDPIKNEDFIAQLATFSSLEQLISINKAVTALAGNSEKTENASGSGSDNPA